jgi:lactate dehydrogenase-like 2-hydroxyacid dehydrogenase
LRLIRASVSYTRFSVQCSRFLKGNDMATTPDFSVRGRHVLITGGTGGIGGAFAKAFLDHGANVTVADIAAPKDRTDPRIRYEQLDVRDDAAVEALAARVPKLDVLIHCAGRASAIVAPVTLDRLSLNNSRAAAYPSCGTTLNLVRGLVISYDPVATVPTFYLPLL